VYIQGGSNMTGTNCDLFTHKSSRSYLNHLVYMHIHASCCMPISCADASIWVHEQNKPNVNSKCGANYTVMGHALMLIRSSHSYA
jgi:hypothetical protein